MTATDTDAMHAARLAVAERRLDDHDKVLVDIRDHLRVLAGSVGSWDKRFVVLIAVLAAGSPTGQKVITQLVG